jgi:leader peptidase (prepilin peptidase)/N-methyltransferase
MDYELIYQALFGFWVFTAFLLGAAVGSFLNVCAYRLPYEKSVFWPGSRCGNCYQPIRLRDNIPLVSYWLLRGRCRTCGTPFSVRYFLVELITGLLFAGLFYLEIGRNVLDLPYLRVEQHWIHSGVVPIKAWVVFGYHAVLLSFLILVSLCDLMDMEIPLSITLTGTTVGLLGSTLFPWPWPGDHVGPLSMVAGAPLLPSGLYPWPVWYPLPSWLPPGSWQLGLATGLAGVLAGNLALRGVRFLYWQGRGKEGMGFGDADLMMMAGAFVGWQPVVIGFFMAVFPGLLFGLATLIRSGDQPLPFGPSLALGVLATLLTWPTVGNHFRLLFFDPWVLLVLGVGGGVILLITSFLLRLVRGTPEQPGMP